MTEILEFVIAVVSSFFAVRAIIFFLKRTSFYTRLKRFASSSDLDIEFYRSPYRSFFRLSDMPEFSIVCGNTVYLLRTYNGYGAGQVVHFASKTYTVRFSRFKGAIFLPTLKKYRAPSVGLSIGARVRLLPELRGIELFSSEEMKIVPVIVFNPAPGEVSYVTEEKTSIQVAFTGDEIYGTKIFTASTFLTYIDRVVRNEKYKKELIRK